MHLGGKPYYLHQHLLGQSTPTKHHTVHTNLTNMYTHKDVTYTHKHTSESEEGGREGGREGGGLGRGGTTTA